MSDPDGNDVELHWDRPMDEWPHGPGGRLTYADVPGVTIEDVLALD